jgi:O-methyltransferase domain/Dimerisation domain
MTAPSVPKKAVTPLEALNRLTDIATGYTMTQALVAGCQLGVFDALSQRTATLEELASKTGVPALGCRRLLSALEEIGLVERENGGFRSSELGNYCSSKAPVNLAPLTGLASPFSYLWEFLQNAIRENSPQWIPATGASSADTFAAIYSDPAGLRRFCALMNAQSVIQGQEVAACFDFKPFRCVMDVAGGVGGISTQIGRRFPHIKGIITDLPPVCEVATEYIAAAGLTGRFTTVRADLLEGPYPRSADVITLGWILHDWSDDTCRTILRNCHQALPPEGALLIIEKVLNDDYSAPSRWAWAVDLMMQVCCEPGARERNEAEYGALLEESGFRLEKVIRMNAPRDVVVARKPSVTA